MFRHYRWRIAMPYVVLILTIMTGLLFYLSNVLRQFYQDRLETQLLDEARLISDSFSQSLVEWNQSGNLDVLAKHWDAILNSRVTLIAADGTVLGESREDRALMENHLSRPEVQQAIEAGQGIALRYSNTLGQDMMYAAVPVVENNRRIGFVRLAVSLQQVDANIRRIQNSLLVVMLVASGMAVLLAYAIAARTTRALQQLSDEALRISTGKIQRVTLPTSQDEIYQLALAIDNMASQSQAQIEEIKAEGSKLTAVLQQMTDGVLIVDHLGSVQLVNPAAARMFNIHEQAAINRSVAEVVRHYQIVELWQRCLESKEDQVITLEVGAQRSALQVIATNLGSSLPGNTLLLVQDITRLRQLETVRRDFISNISHELRTPLASLKALTETLIDGALEDPPTALRFLQRIETEVDSLSLMVSELLELSRIESGKVPLHLQGIKPSELLHSAVERLGLQAERAGLTLELQADAEVPDILADPPRIEQVIVNLLHNAIKFTPPGGVITLSIYQETAGEMGDQVVFSVKDTGVGIPSRDLPRIFERFYKADRARSGGGTGLGLAIARHMVEAHGGRIWVESREGMGSTFSFSIPASYA